MENNLQHSRLTRTASSACSTESLPSEDRARLVTELLCELPLVHEALRRLKKELPSNLKYHSLQHTHDVLSCAIALGVQDGLDENKLTLLAIAAAWHDTGFIVQTARNEPIAAAWVREAMKSSGGYSEDEIGLVENAILDTQIKIDLEHHTLYQESSGGISPWLLDADLSNLGQKDFMVKSMQVYSEMRGKDIASPEELSDEAGRGYIANTIRLLAHHRWHSAAGRNTFEKQEAINLSKLGVLLAELVDSTAAGLRRAWLALH
jgi:uncharacterized protein